MTHRAERKNEQAMPELPQRPLGRTGVTVSILGLGGVGFLTDWTDRDAIAQFLNEIIDSGINYIDTARMYGEGKSEESLGLVMGTPRRKEVLLATKTVDRTYDGAMKDVETSLKALRTDYLDVIQVHGFGDSKEDDVAALGKEGGALYALQRLRDEKVVRFIGVTGHPGWPGLKEVTATYDFDTLLCFVNPRAACRWVDEELLPIAQRKNMGIIAMKTFGGETPGELVGNGDGKAPAPLLLRYSLSAPITLTVPAIANRDELRENLEVVRNFIPLSDEERSALIARINPSEGASDE